jgi:diaminopimelate epimerase
MQIAFTKMNGAGNDFVVFDNRTQSIPLEKNLLARLCDRHRGVGADGVLAVEPPSGRADFRMRYFNADGGEAEMCGNGARCFARYAARLLAGDHSSVSFETIAGTVSAQLRGETVTLDMGRPHAHRDPRLLEISNQQLAVHSINTGVPHAVVFAPDVESLDIRTLGAGIRHHAEFAPAGTNANFVEVVEPAMLLIRTYERGVEDETLACGTGVCAAALSHACQDNVPSPIHVRVRGGDTLRVDFETNGDGAFETVHLTGPADFVFEGSISL